ncbi:hypothetical protein [Legionella feeleii]|uniref:Uncharacterized protein n=1 Tax=Legionella feeleii TaxID=453 RepID=A0A0W0TGZ0_9GAMM|nr:hypothetical protein [Legionella feeleii]KTC94895.1 hypothetical protein Lfee_2559 [Legionella feeleii]SPX59847.1 Uncharacterised protein [Legionella feeleii]
MNNKNKYLGLSLLSLLSFNVFAITEDQGLLKSFHEYGMTKCDKFILHHASLKNKPHWSFDIEKPHAPLGKGYSVVGLVEVYGYKGDTVKKDFSFLETPDQCILTQRSTITFSGPCSENINGDYWYISNQMPEKDYTEYRNKGNAPMLAKEVNVGNFKLCIQEIRSTRASKHG